MTINNLKINKTLLILLIITSNLIYCADKNQKLMNATIAGNLQEVTELLNNPPIDVNSKDERGNTLLIYAVLFDHLKIVQQLLEHNAKVNLQNNQGYTALIYAATLARKNMVELLLKHKADPNIKNNDGLTAYTLASYGVKKNPIYSEIAKRLLEAGADSSEKSKKGN